MDELGALQWDDIRFFLALARAGSLSRAARALRVEHSTVARRVTSLEAALALRLFDRLASGWSLTAEGEELLAKAGAVEAQILGLARIARERDPMAGRVRISAPPVLLAELLMPAVASLCATHPGLTIELEGSRREADMMRAEADIALRIGLPEAGDLIARRIAEIRYGLYGAPGMPEGRAPSRRSAATTWRRWHRQPGPVLGWRCCRISLARRIRHCVPTPPASRPSAGHSI